MKLLRIFTGVPGGSKVDGVKQLQIGMDQGVLMAVDSRFIFATLVRQYDLKYEEALAAAEPLAAKYPRNPLFCFWRGIFRWSLGARRKRPNIFMRRRNQRSDPLRRPRARHGQCLPGLSSLAGGGVDAID